MFIKQTKSSRWKFEKSEQKINIKSFKKKLNLKKKWLSLIFDRKHFSKVKLFSWNFFYLFFYSDFSDFYLELYEHFIDFHSLLKIILF